MWNGVGAAASEDGVHFADQGVVIQKDRNAVWLGSGSVLRNAAGDYVMNFSEEYDCVAANRSQDGNRCQSIFFATSPDLRTWTRVPFARAGPAGSPPHLGEVQECISTDIPRAPIQSGPARLGK